MRSLRVVTAVASACAALASHSAIAHAQPSPAAASLVEIDSDVATRVELRASSSMPTHACHTPCAITVPSAVYWLETRDSSPFRVQVAAIAPRNRLLLHLPHTDRVGSALTATGAIVSAGAIAMILASYVLTPPSQLSLTLLFGGLTVLFAGPSLLVPGVVLLLRSPSTPWIERVDPPRDPLANPLIVRQTPAIIPTLSFAF